MANLLSAHQASHHFNKSISNELRNQYMGKRFSSIFKTLSVLLLIAAITLSPKTSTWLAYSNDGTVIEDSAYQLYETTSRYTHDKCSYVSLLFGLGTGMTQSEPALPDQFEGVKIELLQDGKRAVSAKTNYSSLLITHEKNRSDPGSARHGMQKT